MHRVAGLFKLPKAAAALLPWPFCRFCAEGTDPFLPSTARPEDKVARLLLQAKKELVADTQDHNRRFIEMLRGRPFIEEVAIVLEPEACIPCRQQSLRVAVHELPVLPWVRCIKPEGCGCWYKPADKSAQGTPPGAAKLRPMQRAP